VAQPIVMQPDGMDAALVAARTAAGAQGKAAASPERGAEDALAAAEVVEAAAPAEAEDRPRLVGLRGGLDPRRAVDGAGADAAFPPHAADPAPALRLVPGGRDRDLGAPRDPLEAVRARGTQEPGDARRELPSDPGPSGIAAPAASGPSSLASEGAEASAATPARDAVDQITTRLRDIKGPGRHEISVRLDPPDLGSVRIDARLEGARLHVQIRAEHAPTGEMLADALPRIRESLVQQGFVPMDVSVQLGMDTSARQFTRDGSPTFTPAPHGERVAPPPAVPAAARAVPISDGLDVWA
jgi:flagellar hook-length control protein FliK